MQSYLSINGAVTQEFAGTLPDAPSPPGCAATPPQVEDVPDQPLAFFGVAGNYSGIETIYRCGFPPATAPYSLTVTDAGGSVTTTPAGIFPTHQWAGTFTSFGAQRIYAVFVNSGTIIERDVSFYNTSGALTETTTLKLASGVIGNVFPGPSFLLTQDN